jgi:hypothetical protein
VFTGLDDWCDQNDPMDIGKARQRLYKVLEDLLEGVFEVNGEPDVIEKLHKLYGQKLFRCRHHACARSSEGFETTAQRNRHEDQHGRLYKCLAENCLYNEVGFTSKTSLQKHTRESHNTSVSRHREVKKLEVLIRFQQD